MKRIIFCFAVCMGMLVVLGGCGTTEERGTAQENVYEDTETDAEAEEVMPETDVKEMVPETDAEAAMPETDVEKEEVLPETVVPETGAETEKEPVAWAGKKVSFCGDSMSTFTGYIPDNYSKFYPENGDIQNVEDTWWMQVVSRTGMELCANASYSGSTVSGQSQDNQDGRFACGNKRIEDLAGAEGALPDVIIILMGANDLLNNIPLGSYDGTSAAAEGDIQTFSEAYALMLDKMMARYPEAEIYCCTIAEVSRWNEEGGKFPFTNAQGAAAADYNAWITSIAQNKGAQVIDVYRCGLTYENAKENTSDGTHPNAAGAKLIADKVCEAFR